MKTIQFGYHLTLDLYGCPLELLSNMELCYKILDELPDLLEMRKLTTPYVVSADSNEKEGGKDPGGFSGFIMIAESHISLHTFAKRGFISLDLYSCKKFNYHLATDYLMEVFRPKDFEVHKVNRGMKYPAKNIYE